jgi:CheY-like chemotaxis protein
MASLPVLPSPASQPLRARLRAAQDAHQSSRVPFVLLLIFLMGTIAVLSCGGSASGYHLGNALIWGFGFCVSGMLLGFLFAIPRILPAGAIIASARAPATPGGKRETDPASAGVVSHNGQSPSEINSNLVEVSDWLTKIIVGVGLVELKHLPTVARGVADYIAPSLGLAPAMAAPVAGGIMLFYSVLGFLIGYLLTRIYLAVIIKWADNQVKNLNPVRLDSGAEIDASELIRLHQTALADMQEAVVNIVSAMPEQSGLAASPTAPVVLPGAPGRILWMDGRPANNALLIEQLTRANVVVEQVLTSKDALECLAKSAQSFDIVVTDMAGFEHGRSVPDAGIALTRAVLRLLPEQPVLVYCTKKEAEMHGVAATEAGARLVTTSGTQLIAVAARILKAAGRPILIG